MLDAVIAVVALATVLAIILVFALSLRLRQREIQTVFKIGCSRMTIAKLVAAEIIDELSLDMTPDGLLGSTTITAQRNNLTMQIDVDLPAPTVPFITSKRLSLGGLILLFPNSYGFFTLFIFILDNLFDIFETFSEKYLISPSLNNSLIILFGLGSIFSKFISSNDL